VVAEMKDLLPTCKMKRINLLIPEFFYDRLCRYAETYEISIKDAAELEILASMFFRNSISFSIPLNTEEAEKIFTDNLSTIIHRMDSICPRITSSIVELAKLADYRLKGKIVRRLDKNKTNQ
jgi:hypothetical protein